MSCIVLAECLCWSLAGYACEGWCAAATHSLICAIKVSHADRGHRAELKSKIAERTLAAMQRPDVKEKIARAVSRRQASVKAGPWAARLANLQVMESFSPRPSCVASLEPC